MSGPWGDVALAAVIGGVLWRIAWRDATRLEVGWDDVLVLGGLGVWWQGLDAWATVVAGVVLGAGAIVGQMAIARWRGKRMPVFGGDAMLMGGVGAVLGPLGLAVSWMVNVPAGLAYRWWLGRRRGRSCLRGYVPAGPAYCLAAGVVLAWQAVTGRDGWGWAGW